MSNESCQMPQPTPEHARLESGLGRWNVKCTYFMDPSQPPMVCDAVETVEPVGPFWTVSLFESEFMGMPFRGRSTLGYDPQKKKWVGTWVDSMSPSMFVMEGGYDAAGKVLTMHCRGPHMATGEMVDFRCVTTHTGPETHEFDMYMTDPQHGEVQMFRHEYSRA